MKKIFLKLFFSLSLITLLTTSYWPHTPKVLATSEQVGSWSQTTDLPYRLASHTSFTNSNDLFVINGSAVTGQTHSEIIRSTILSNYSLSSWTTISNLPTPLIWHTMTKSGDNIYILGGYIDGTGGTFTPVNTVSHNILSNNTLSNWSTIRPLPSALAMGSATVVNNKIYFSGGGSGGYFNSISSKVYMADIKEDGTIGTWSETTPLPTPLFGHGMIETGSKIVIIGGRTAFLTASDKVYEANINLDGSLESWTEKSPLPQPNANFGTAKVGNTVYLVGGTNYPGRTSTNLNNVYYANIENGSIGSWSESQNKLPKATGSGSLAATDTHLYYTGGYNTYYTNNVWVAEIQGTTPNPLPSLNVTDIKQYTEPWASQIYDTASKWSQDPTIKRWGCALTSASMVLQYYNHPIFPDALNTWLNSQPDGYLRNGLLNWLSISKYTKQHDTETSPTLEYKRLPADSPTLITELKEGRPSILQEPGHFVVAKSQLPTTFGINDPAYSTKPTLESYGNSFEAIGSYKKTHTDLSYILLAVDPDITMSVFGPDGNLINGFSYIDQPLTDDIDSLTTSNQPLNIFLYPIPAQGKYIVELTGENNIYRLDSYIYNKSGEVNTSSDNGFISEDKKDTFEITIDENNNINSINTFESLLKDIDSAWNLKLISKLQMCNLIKLEVQLAQKLYLKGNIQAVKSLLAVTKLHLKLLTPSFIDQSASDIIQNEVQSLLDSITQTS